jgi:hypothetical protein
MVIAAREEALTAVEIHNSPLSPRPLEGFLVHMHMAWLYTLHAGFERAGVDYRYRRPNGHFVRVDGEPKSWELQRCIETRWIDINDPVRANLELTVRLRNKIEHRYERGLQIASYGFTQALMTNFEAELLTLGADYSIADRVHLPVALSTFSREGAVALAKAQMSLPRRLRDFFIDYRGGLTDEVLSDRAFEFRIEILQKRAPASEADLAVSFVRIEDLDEDERDAYEALERAGRVILRDKIRDVANAGWMKPAAAAAEVQRTLGIRFSPSAEFPKAWKHFEVRPPSGATGDDRAKTDPRYCRWDAAFEGYVYSSAFVKLLEDELAEPAAFEAAIGWKPHPIS